MNAALIAKGKALSGFLSANRITFGSLVQPELDVGNTLPIDLSIHNRELRQHEESPAEVLWQLIWDEVKRSGKTAAYGGYAEKRVWYRRNSDQFGTGDRERCIHLGIDIWMPSGTTLYTPLNATVHSLANNKGDANYGPTIVLRHELDGTEFFSLYGHLSTDSLAGLRAGDALAAGSPFAQIGNIAENGNWPPHVHVQLIADMLGQQGDFIGVCSEVEKEGYLNLCPEPLLFQ